jgi:hypothetical protein
MQMEWFWAPTNRVVNDNVFMDIALKKDAMMEDGTLELPIGETIYVLLIYVSMIKGISVETTVLVHRIVIGLLKRDRPSCASIT